MKKTPLPKSVRLPGGYLIKVLFKDKQEMGTFSGMADPPDAFWYADGQQIWIDKRFGNKKKWALLGHEMAHAVVDWRGWLLDQKMAAWE